MLTTLIHRELLDNLMTFRFATAVLIMLLLVVANTFVLNFNQIWGSGYHHEYFHRDSSTLRYDYHAVSNIEELSEASKPQVPHAQDYYRFLGPQIVNTAERTWLVRKQALETIFVQLSVSCVRFVGVVACEAEYSESCDTSVDVGHLRGFYAEHACLYCKRIFSTDDL